MSEPNLMTAAVLYGREEVRIERIPVPDVGHGEVRVRIGAALTCGTDVKVFRRGYHARMIRPPAVFGHEFAGTIDSVGVGVTRWQIGQRVVAANSAPCGDCYYCRRAAPELCEDLLFLNGAYAEAVTVPARIVAKNLYEIPDSLSFAEAALTEPLACVVRGMAAVPVRAGETVAVLGLGPIGLLFVRLCVLAGARVLAAGRRSERLALAAELGAAEVFDIAATPDILPALRSRTEGERGPDKVIEAVGHPEAWEQAISLVRKAGTVSLFGGCPAETFVRLDTHRVHYDELTLVGAFHHTPDTFRQALDLIACDDVPARAFLQQTALLTALPSVLTSLLDGSNGAVKTVIQP
ncbi:MAG: Threonine dehydrogenase and related Zn-dependent dehydrogenase [Chthonomonadales bacterium]|nr:Threonine dehydrogenase and related Zn-dependent dehydrogenase [Chthonomonadales bacterium]